MVMDLHGISQAADDLVVESEVTSHAAFDKVYHLAEWPGGASGVTWGIGYDGGQSSRDTIIGDWKGKVSDGCLASMVRCAGVTGESAHRLLPSVKNSIDVTWDVAMQVFADRDIPKYLALVRSHLLNTAALPPDCLGSLFSLVYNRGASFDNAGDRYREMHAIKLHMAAKEFAKIPGEFRSMKRLWPGKNERGLLVRRDKEAALFERGLAQIGHISVVPPASAVIAQHVQPVVPKPIQIAPQDAHPSQGPSLWDNLIGLVTHHAA